MWRYKGSSQPTDKRGPSKGEATGATTAKMGRTPHLSQCLGTANHASPKGDGQPFLNGSRMIYRSWCVLGTLLCLIGKQDTSVHDPRLRFIVLSFTGSEIR